MFFIKAPFTMVVAGPTSCGKTTFVINLIKRFNKTNTFNKIVWCNSEHNAIPREIHEQTEMIVLQNVPKSFQNIENNSLIILDDLMTEAYNKNVCELFTKGSHHKNLSVILIIQNLFHQGKYCRDISLNSQYLIIFKNPRDRSQIIPLARQVYPQKMIELVKAYNDATNEPHGYLLLDLTQAANDLVRFRTNIFNEFCLTCYCPNDMMQHDSTFYGENICNKYDIIDGKQIYTITAEIGKC